LRHDLPYLPPRRRSPPPPSASSISSSHSDPAPPHPATHPHMFSISAPFSAVA